MKITGERKEIVWTLTLSDSEMASLHCILHGCYDPETVRNRDLRQADLREHRHNISELIRQYNYEADRLEREG